jgi:Uma2 family endonuclease
LPFQPSYDLGPKLALYLEGKVPEYLTALREERRVEWRVLKDDRYELLKPDADGILKAEIFPGLWLDPQALFADDLNTPGATAELGIQHREKRAGG